MKKFCLQLKNKSWIPEIDKILKLRRKFHTIQVRQDSKEFTYVTRKILSYYGAQLRCFTLEAANVQSMQGLFQLTPLLESLELSDISLTSTEDKVEPAALPNLKSLRIGSNCNEEILNHIDGAKKLTSLSILSLEDRDIVLPFLMKLPSLESLVIGDRNLLENAALTLVPFRLKKFMIRGLPINVAPFAENLKNFLKLHEATMQHLNIRTALDSEIHQTVFTQFKNLQSLRLNVDSLPTEKSFYYCMAPLTTVKTLKLHGRFRSHEVAKLFISFFPAVEELDMSITTSLWSSKFLKVIAAHQPNLQHLSINNFFKGTPPNLLFKKLKSLQVNVLTGSFWINFVLTNRTLEAITVNKINANSLTQQDITNILELPSMHYMNFTGDTTIIKKIYEVIRRDQKKLQTVELRVYAQENVKIIFPRDTKHFDFEPYDCKFA